MGKNYSVYIADDELAEWIDDMSENVFDGDTAFFKKCVQLTKDEYEDTFEKMRVVEDDDGTNFV